MAGVAAGIHPAGWMKILQMLSSASHFVNALSEDYFFFFSPSKVTRTIHQFYSWSAMFLLFIKYFLKDLPYLLQKHRMRQAATLALVLIASWKKHANEGLMMDELQPYSPGMYLFDHFLTLKQQNVNVLLDGCPFPILLILTQCMVKSNLHSYVCSWVSGGFSKVFPSSYPSATLHVCDVWLGTLIGWVLIAECAWESELNSGFERKHKISGESSLATMLLNNFFTRNVFN